MKKVIRPERDIWEKLCERPLISLKEIQLSVRGILDGVKEGGEKALLEFTRKFDKKAISNVIVSESDLLKAEGQISQSLKKAINIAKDNIEAFHRTQIESLRKVETMPGVVCWRKSVPIQKVGIYIPGGTAPLFSTILMLAIPAKLAGCKRIVLCSPPGENGLPHPAVLYTAHHLGISEVFRVGGAQAIAALTYGTENIPKVDKIFGPGNQYVTMAKQMVSQEGVAIDMPAGPSEVAIIADETAHASFVAADLLSQAEHGTDSQVILITNSEEKLDEVLRVLDKQLADLPRQAIATKALENSYGIVLDNLDEMAELCNIYAPEHLILSLENSDEFAEKIYNAGSVFLGHFTPESVGDYASGTNHTLPTNGYARSYSGVSLDSFVKKITYQKLSKEGLQNLGPHVETMAEAEDLHAHSRAVKVRLDYLRNQ